MPTSVPPTATRPKRGVLRPVLAVGIPVLVVALVVALGGFRRAPGAGLGPELPAGESIVLARWDIEVISAEYVNRAVVDYEIDDTIRVTLRLTWKGEESTYGMTNGLVEVRGVDAEARSSPRTIGHDRSGDFDPGIAQTVAFEVRYPDTDRDPVPTVTPPTQVQVVIKDEERYESYLGGESWRLTDTVGHVRLDCPDHRERS